MAGLYLFCASFTNAPVVQKRQELMQQKAEVTAPQKVIIKFLRWYKANFKKANSFPLLITDKAGNSIVSKTGCSNYLAFIKSSGYLSEKYIGYWQKFFDDKAIELKTNPVGTDIPEGFDMDLVLITQEPDLVLNKIETIKFKTVSMNNSVALIGAKFPFDKTLQYEFEMYKDKGGWKIAYISTPNFD